MPPALWLIPVALTLCGAAALLLGLRGRRVDDHPICRKCRFDLFGLPEGSNRCSECGADLSPRRAVHVGQRERRPRLLWLGTPSLVLGVGLLAAMAWAAAKGVDLLRHKPTWWLTRETASADPTTRDWALQELTRRLKDGQLSDEQVSGLVERALAHQADRSKPWDHAWGTFVEQTHLVGRLPPEDWQRYLRQAQNFRLRVRPRVRRGDPLPILVWWEGSRVGSSGRFHYTCSWSLSLGGRRSLNSGGIIGSNGLPGVGRYWPVTAAEVDDDLLAELEDGPQTATVVMDLKVRDRFSRPAPNGSDPDRPAPVRKTVELTADWTLLPGDTPSVKVIDDPSLRAAVDSSLEVKPIQRLPADGQRPERYRLRVDPSRPPVGLAFDVVLRGAGGREWPMGAVTFKAGAVTERLLEQPAPGLDSAEVDVVFRPNPSAACEKVDLMEMWDGTVVVKGVAVTAWKEPVRQARATATESPGSD